MKAWKDMTGKERAAYARSFIGKKKSAQQKADEHLRRQKKAPLVVDPIFPASERVAEAVLHSGASATVELGAAFASMTQEQRDAILRHPAINRPRRP